MDTVIPILQMRKLRRHSHGDPTSLAPHERLTDLAVVPREKPHTGAAAREQPRDSPVKVEFNKATLDAELPGIEGGNCLANGESMPPFVTGIPRV